MTDLGTFVVPDRVGDPLVAWRAWHLQSEVVGDRPRIVLRSINQGFTWEPRQVLVGQCSLKEPTHSADETPKDGCQCGIHALRNPLGLAKIGYTCFIGPNKENVCWGQVELWGRIIEGTYGIKAQYAYPKNVYLREDARAEFIIAGGKVEFNASGMQKMIREQYGIPVQIVTYIYREDTHTDELTLRSKES